MGEIVAKVTSKGQVTLPAELRERLGIEAGDHVHFVEQPDGSFTLKVRSGSLSDLKGMLREEAKITVDQLDAWIDEARSRAAPRPRKDKSR